MKIKNKLSKKHFSYILVPLVIFVAILFNQPSNDVDKIVIEDKTNEYSQTSTDSTPKNTNDEQSSNSLTLPTSNQEQSRTVDINKHPSTIIKDNPGAADVPYYLLTTVNDPEHNQTWAHSTIQASRAWELSTGSEQVTVAVIDSGFALNHEDLEDKWFINVGETGMTEPSDHCWTGTPEDKSSNNCDDDQNDFVDDWRGYDFFNDSNNPQAGKTNPNGEGVSHGTMVAGVVGATANNNKGSAGIDHSSLIMPLQIFSDDGEAYTTDLVAAIEYATDNGADIINLSLGTNMIDNPLPQAIRYARDNNIVVIAASGNCALNDFTFCNNLTGPGRMLWPALYDETIAVGATTSSDVRAAYSSYGPKLDMVAPGSNIGPLPVYSTSNQTSYSSASGTSFAAPLVVGVASLLIAQDDTLSVEDIEFLLTQSVDKITQMQSETFTNQHGYGRLNAHQATLLSKANLETENLGPLLESIKEPPTGAIWRTNSDRPIENDETILIGCRVFGYNTCSVIIKNQSTNELKTGRHHKGRSIEYIFIKASTLQSGNSNISIHSCHLAASLGDITR